MVFICCLKLLQTLNQIHKNRLYLTKLGLAVLVSYLSFLLILIAIILVRNGNHYYQDVLTAQINLILSHHLFLLANILGNSSRKHPLSTQLAS